MQRRMFRLGQRAAHYSLSWSRATDPRPNRLEWMGTVVWSAGRARARAGHGTPDPETPSLPSPGSKSDPKVRPRPFGF